MVRNLTDATVLGFFCLLYRLSVTVLRLRAKREKAFA
jgi:hypothetical protein